MAYKASTLLEEGRLEESHRVLADLFEMYPWAEGLETAEMGMQVRVLPLDAKVYLNGEELGEGDLTFLYAIEAGQIDMAELTRPAWQIDAPAAEAVQLQRGLFNPLRGVAAGGNRGNAGYGVGPFNAGNPPTGRGLGAMRDPRLAPGAHTGPRFGGNAPVFGGAANIGATNLLNAQGAAGGTRAAGGPQAPFMDNQRFGA